MDRDLFARIERVRYLLGCPPFGLIMDVDGTISEIAPTPDAACVSTAFKDHLHTLAKHLGLVAAVSGRSVDDVRRMVGVDELVYVGNHGLEWWINGQARPRRGVATYTGRIARAVDEIQGQLPAGGVVIENKGATAAIHYRQVEEPELARSAIQAAIRNSPAAQVLRITEGKMVIELRPPLSMNKGWALARLVRSYSLKSVLYLGDDVTDVDAFVLLRKLQTRGTVNGLAVAVLGSETPVGAIECADATLRGVPEVEGFLRWLVGEVGGRATANSTDAL